MKFADLLHNLINLTHGSFGDETSAEAHAAVDDLEKRLTVLENDVRWLANPNVSRETSPDAAVDLTKTTTVPMEGADDGAQ